MESQNKTAEILKSLIVYPREMEENINNGKYNYYQIVDLKTLEKAALNDGISKEAFSQMIQKDLHGRLLQPKPKKRWVIPVFISLLIHKYSNYWRERSLRIRQDKFIRKSLANGKFYDIDNGTFI